VTLLAADETGMVVSTTDENTNALTVTLGSWPSIEGTWQHVPDGLPETRLRLVPVWRGESNSRTISRIEAVVDPDGHFEFPRVMPGDYWLSRIVHIQFTDSRGTEGEDRSTRVMLEPGQHLRLDVKATGRPVTGRLVHGDGSPVTGQEFRGSLVRHPTPKPPSNFRDMSRAERETWNNEHRSTFHLQFDSEGGLLGREVPPGTYRLDVQGETPVGNSMRPFQVRGLEVVVPPWPEDKEPTRFDIGDINVDQAATRPATGSAGRLPPPMSKEKPNSTMIRLQRGAGVLVLAALGLSVYRRWRTRIARRARSAMLPLLLLGLGLAGSVQALGQPAELPDMSALLPIVRAVEAYKRDCGLWPQRLEDLIATYISSAGPGCTYEWSWTGYVHVGCQVGAQQLVFVFNGDDRGWYAGRPGRYRVLAITPPVSVEPPRPRLLGDALIVPPGRIELGQHVLTARVRFRHAQHRVPCWTWSARLRLRLRKQFTALDGALSRWSYRRPPRQLGGTCSPTCRRHRLRATAGLERAGVARRTASKMAPSAAKNTHTAHSHDHRNHRVPVGTFTRATGLISPSRGAPRGGRGSISGARVGPRLRRALRKARGKRVETLCTDTARRARLLYFCTWRQCTRDDTRKRNLQQNVDFVVDSARLLLTL
jgi:hypothetical protein